MRRYVRKHISMCPECVLTKCPAGKQPVMLHPIPAGTRPFEIIHADHLVPFIKSRRGRSYSLVVIDNFTLYTLLRPAKDTSAQGVIKVLEPIFKERGIPKRLITDRGTSLLPKSSRISVTSMELDIR